MEQTRNHPLNITLQDICMILLHILIHLKSNTLAIMQGLRKLREKFIKNGDGSDIINFHVVKFIMGYSQHWQDISGG